MCHTDIKSQCPLLLFKPLILYIFFSVYKTTPCQEAQLWLFILITAIIKIFLSFQVCVSRWGWAYEGHPCLWDMCFCMFNGPESCRVSPSITLCLFSESGLVLQLGAWGILFCFVFVVGGYFFSALLEAINPQNLHISVSLVPELLACRVPILLCPCRELNFSFLIAEYIL